MFGEIFDLTDSSSYSLFSSDNKDHGKRQGIGKLYSDVGSKKLSDEFTRNIFENKKSYTSFGECTIPCTIHMINQSILSSLPDKDSLRNDKNFQNTTNGNSNNNFNLFGKNVGAVVMRGWLGDVQKYSSRLMFDFYDGTGKIKVYFNTLISYDSNDDENNFSQNSSEKNYSQNSEKQSPNKNDQHETLCKNVMGGEFNIKNSNDDDNDKLQMSNDLLDTNNHNWRHSILDIIKKNNLICIVGTPVVRLNRSHNERIQDTNFNSDKDSHQGLLRQNNDVDLFTLEACHFREILDFNEYLLYSDMEIIFTFMNLFPNEDHLFNPSKKIDSKTDDTLNFSTSSPNNSSSNNSNNDSPKSVSLPDNFDKIIDTVQRQIIKTILTQSSPDGGGVSTKEIVTYLATNVKHISANKIQDEIANLIEDGELFYTYGDFVDIT